MDFILLAKMKDLTLHSDLNAHRDIASPSMLLVAYPPISQVLIIVLGFQLQVGTVLRLHW